ncbi:helix-turn-helix domain-containing protein [Streptomyces sp. NPDC094437]|uniref:helix-turn-helix domain-containing protein n=1 Tax=Streptomyces sp. NPDC094437 TaxID=3366060 RepID=UPI0037F7DF2B
MTAEVRENVKKFRRAAGMNQEDLAAASGLSVSTVQKVEQGGQVLTETLHAIARGLGVPTSTLFAAGSPAPVVGDETTRQQLASLRTALMPPVGLESMIFTPVPEIQELAALRRSILDAHALYRADRYDSVAASLPPLLIAAAAAARRADDSERREAMTVHALALLVTGKYATQVRQYDMAYHALSEGIRLAREAGDRQTAAVGVIGLCWLLLRQNRFDECYQLATATAQLMEPRMTETDPGRISVWGELWMRAAAASIRDNRPDDAAIARGFVARAAGGMKRQDQSFPSHWGGFGPATAAIKAAEDCLITGQNPSDARETLRRAGADTLKPKALKHTGKPTAIDWSRHRLDVGSALTILGAHQDAMDELTSIKATQGMWLKHQPMARRVMSDVLKSRKRTLTQEMREMASYLGVVE